VEGKQVRTKTVFIALFLALVALASCATAPSVPSWALTTPPPDGANTYFVGSASGANAAAAVADATSNLIAGIMQYLGVKVKVSTSATAKASVDEYSASLRQTVETESNNRLAGFQVKQKYVQTDKKTGAVTVWILASYATAELNKEKARIAALFQEKIDAVAKPEAEGDRLAFEGKAVEAAMRYIEAMVAASGSDIENADIKLERNANKARAQVAAVSFASTLGNELKATLGAAPAKAVEFLVTAGAGAPIAGAAVNVSYPRKLPNGKLGTRTEALVTDARGVARLVLPAPDFVGKGRIVARLDLSSVLELLDKVPRKYDALRSALEDEIGAKGADLAYAVSSAAASVPMAIFLVDLDERGVPLSQGGAAQGGLAEALTKEGFSIRALALDPAMILLPSDKLLSALSAAAPAGTGRLAYGEGKLLSVRKDGAFFVASAAGSLKVAELATGRILYAADKSWQAVASDEATARRTALRELGSQIFGKDLLASLP